MVSLTGPQSQPLSGTSSVSVGIFSEKALKGFSCFTFNGIQSDHPKRRGMLNGKDLAAACPKFNFPVLTTAKTASGQNRALGLLHSCGSGTLERWRPRLLWARRAYASTGFHREGHYTAETLPMMVVLRKGPCLPEVPI